MTTATLFHQMEEKMKKTLEALKREFHTIRTGRASPSILDKIVVECYGTEVPLKQVANVSTPDVRLLLIQPFDKSVIGSIEKAIQKSDLGLNPAVDGSVIRLSIPPLTEERRKELVKVIKKKVEEGKVAVRNIRREFNDELKVLEKNERLPEDEVKRAQDQIQKITDRYIKEFDDAQAAKEKEILEV